MTPRGTYTFDPSLAPADREAVLGLAVRLLQAQERVRILKGGYRGDLATVTGRGLAGGVTVTTDSGVPLAYAVTDLEVIGA